LLGPSSIFHFSLPLGFWWEHQVWVNFFRDRLHIVRHPLVRLSSFRMFLNLPPILPHLPTPPILFCFCVVLVLGLFPAPPLRFFFPSWSSFLVLFHWLLWVFRLSLSSLFFLQPDSCGIVQPMFASLRGDVLHRLSPLDSPPPSSFRFFFFCRLCSPPPPFRGDRGGTVKSPLLWSPFLHQFVTTRHPTIVFFCCSGFFIVTLSLLTTPFFRWFFFFCQFLKPQTVFFTVPPPQGTRGCFLGFDSTLCFSGCFFL